MEATISAVDMEFIVGTVHMSYTDAFQVTPRKLSETKNLIEQIKDKTRRYILTGDFNAKLDSEVIRLISDRLVSAGPDFTQNTWTTKPFSYGGFEATTLDWRLDHIFTSPDVKVISAEVLKTDVSDHLPISASFDIG